MSHLSLYRIAAFGLCLLAAHIDAFALDTVTRKSTDRRAAGEITAVTATEVTVKPASGNPLTIPVNDIAGIEWDGAPPALGLARAKEAAGQYLLAVTDYETAQGRAPTTKAFLRADIAFGIASATGKLALIDPEQIPVAVSRLDAFLQTHRDHYRRFDALLLLGQVRLAQEDYAAAEQAFREVESAPWTDYQMAAAIGLGRTALSRGDAAAARRAFDQVIETSAATPAETARRFEAMLGQATCLQEAREFDAAAQILSKVILESPASDTRLQAEAYVRQGDCYAASGDRAKDAVLSYLHVDVIPSLAAEKDLHAEALYQLAQLWPQLGHADRADQAAARLQSLYPGSQWAKMLTGG
ncbi:MAG: tetratricopeptide repeat protein [Planctomycetaceae bacterium]|nr:tetratricopeptide repeat protein [Planctomycetaceae bacterium]